MQIERAVSKLWYLSTTMWIASAQKCYILHLSLAANGSRDISYVPDSFYNLPIF